MIKIIIGHIGILILVLITAYLLWKCEKWKIVELVSTRYAILILTAIILILLFGVVLGNVIGRNVEVNITKRVKTNAEDVLL